MNQNGGTMSSAQTDCVFDNGDTDNNGQLSATELINLNEAMVNGDQSVFDGCYDANSLLDYFTPNGESEVYFEAFKDGVAALMAASPEGESACAWNSMLC